LFWHGSTFGAIRFVLSTVSTLPTSLKTHNLVWNCLFYTCRQWRWSRENRILLVEPELQGAAYFCWSCVKQLAPVMQELLHLRPTQKFLKVFKIALI
jgi:hypothetical protein